MEIISGVSDIRTWIGNNNPGNILSMPERIDGLVEALRASEHPAWGQDWEDWLELVTSDDMPGTRANRMPGATLAEIDAARAAWAAADIVPQEERNEAARRAGETVERDADGHVIEADPCPVAHSG